MTLSCGYLDEGPHGEKVGQHGGETLSQAALGNEAKLQLRKTNGVIALLPGPAWDIQKVGLKGEKAKMHGSFIDSTVKYRQNISNLNYDRPNQPKHSFENVKIHENKYHK